MRLKQRITVREGKMQGEGSMVAAHRCALQHANISRRFISGPRTLTPLKARSKMTSTLPQILGLYTRASSVKDMSHDNKSECKIYVLALASFLVAWSDLEDEVCV
ncbi:hypothetical protein CFIMG_007258RA00001 [Ceratocystis fimbriata CBS 114723]|uniref:Uncharacterized protein n=1 Tax=Ceratocystis fimbriata CBS 114723 TaxID=1035309 RepID=A0A2C5WZJ9_9PEZI|nr:hypothetical protein CFIMG_007258RA00001 [Ceratocystis fimbriata CBS 114723]